MKKAVLCSIVVLSFFVLAVLLDPGTCHSVGFIDKMKDKAKKAKEVIFDKEENNSPYLLELQEEEKVIIELLITATNSFLEGAERILSAVGEKEKATEIKGKIKNIKEGSHDPQDLKETMNVSEENKALKEAVGKKVKLSQKAREELREGVVWFGAGNILDVSASKKTSKFIGKLQETINNVKNNPQEYGVEVLSTTKYLKNSLELATSISKNLKDQLPNISITLKELIRYAVIYDLKISVAEFKRKAESIEKEEGF
ncbi:MAG: hypothetical protein GY797_13195 [Deltaproteobacteria bacterium]|nr:hypothetical protein [Deltaproteobacteria bacterium]